MAPPMRVHNTSLPLPALQRLNRCLNAQSSNLYRSVSSTGQCFGPSPFLGVLRRSFGCVRQARDPLSCLCGYARARAGDLNI